MSPADYILAFLSIVLALALQEVLQGFGRIIQAGRFKEPPVAHYLFALCLVVQMVQFWWAMWLWRAIPTWTISAFSLMVLALTLFFLLSFLVFPNEEAQAGEYYMGSARVLWGLQLAQIVVVAVTARMMTALSYDFLTIGPLFLLVILVLVAVRSKDERVHGVVSGIWLVGNAGDLLFQAPIG